MEAGGKLIFPYMCVRLRYPQMGGMMYNDSHIEDASMITRPILDQFKDFIHVPLQDLLLMFKVTINEFYDTVHANENTDEAMAIQLPKGFSADNVAPYFRSDEDIKSYKRLERLRLIMSNGAISECYPKTLDSKKKSENKFFMDGKIYDAELERVMRSTYNQAAQMFGFMELTRTIPDFSRFTPDMGVSVKSWRGNEKRPYINAGYFIPIKCLERGGFNFIEYVFISCLYSSVKSQSITVLNQPADTKVRRRSARTRFENFYDTLENLRKEFVFVFLNHVIDCFDEFISYLANSNEYFDYQEDYQKILMWFRQVFPVAEYIADGYLSSNLDKLNSETVDCKEPLLHSRSLPKLYRYYITRNESFLSNVPVAIYRDACWIAQFTNDVIRLVMESAPELFRAFQESSIIPKEERVYDYMKGLSENNQK